MKLEKTKLTNVTIELITPTRDGNVKTRDLIVKWDDGKQTKYLKLQAKNEKCSILDIFNIGDEVDVTFDIFCAKKHKDNEPYYYQNISLNYIKAAE